MAGFREFVTGEVLTAANVDDFLMKQSVQKYADAAARDAALGTAVAGGNALREGMVAYLDSTDEVIKYDGTAWTTIGNAGIGSNVVSTVLTTKFTSSSTTYTGITGLTATITPSSDTSKILVVVYLSGSSLDVAGSTFHFRLTRGGSAIAVGDAEGSRVQATGNIGTRNTGASTNHHATSFFVDAPNTTSATTYAVEGRVVDAGAFVVNAMQSDSNTDFFPRMISTITVIEVAA